MIKCRGRRLHWQGQDQDQRQDQHRHRQQKRRQVVVLQLDHYDELANALFVLIKSRLSFSQTNNMKAL